MRLPYPKWDPASQKKVRDALIVLGTTLTDTSRALWLEGRGRSDARLISAAMTWGGNPRKDAIYLNYTPSKNDGNTVYKLTSKMFRWMASGRSACTTPTGHLQKNASDAYALNNLTSKKSADGSVVIQFGGCNGAIPNCLPTMPGWNYTVRLYRPRKEVLDGTWKFPEAVAVS